ncbi:MAG: DUF5677 domain-containing protein [Nostoc sp. DedQUE08]|uniref:DUF5677 domain-containing protein n=1 Tax=Nostoc sp. DedQUE08 TaxID=3075393 RepID=UPI002AD422A1|nr:DUF5677 domain-containing protein [Nostoc sp. DedQUE08]MDZ8067979.1 DUF5677 domain-containing protein [Nostoc sp. DedQUE08]
MYKLDYPMLLKIFKSTLIITNKIFNSLYDSETLDARNKLRIRILYIMKLRSETIFKILPQSINANVSFDFPSVAILTRSLIEAYRVFYYLTSEANINDSEFELRYLIFEAYNIFEREKMLKSMEAEELIDEKPKIFEEELQKLKFQIESNNFYKQIKSISQENTKYKLLRDKALFSQGFKNELINFKGCFIKDKEVVLKRLIEKEPELQKSQTTIEYRYEYLYKLLSNYVHISAYSISELPNYSYFKDEFYAEILKTILCTVFYLYVAIEDILNSFPQLREYIGNQEDYSNIRVGIGVFINFLKIPK